VKDRNTGNAMRGAEATVRKLEAHGERHILGLRGDATLPFYDALYRLDHKIEHILTRDERYFSVNLNRTVHMAVADAFGVWSWRVENPEDADSVPRQEADHGEPALVGAISRLQHEANALVSDWSA